MKIRTKLLAQLSALLICTAAVSAATVDGLKLHSSTFGKGPKAVILVHGWTCDETTWQSQVPELAKSYRVITLDLPGHGKSESPKDGKLPIDLFARAIDAVRDEAKVDRCVLAGHSMGTPVIIQYARLYPQHTVALVFVDGPIAPLTNGRLPPPEQFGGPEGLKIREAMIRRMFSSATTPEMQQHILSMMLGAPEATAMGVMESFRNPAIWKEDVFTLPVLGIYSAPSTSHPESMRKRFPKLEYVKMPGTGHFLMLEKPKEFNRLLLSFLGRQKY